MVKEYNINNGIKEKKVDLVQPDGSLLKDIDINDAIGIAKELELDLVEVSTSKNKRNAICKILDYGKLKYKENKKKKSNKQIIKEIRFNFNISEHDLEVKNKKVLQFLEKRYIVRYSLILRGNIEEVLVDKAKSRMENNLEKFKKKGTWTPVKMTKSGRMIRLLTVLSPI